MRRLHLMHQDLKKYVTRTWCTRSYKNVPGTYMLVHRAGVNMHGGGCRCTVVQNFLHASDQDVNLIIQFGW